MQTHKAILANLRNEYNSAKQCAERTSLGLSSDGSNNGINNGEDSAPLNNNIPFHIRAQNETLSNARSIIAETENAAIDVTRELGRQREVISSANEHVNEASTVTDRAQKIVESMQRRKESLFKFR